MWLSVNDRVPNNDSRVIICSMDAINNDCYPYSYFDACEMGFYSDGKWYSDTSFDILDKVGKIGRRMILDHKVKVWYDLENVTHWMPLPNPPKTLKE